MFLDAFKTTKSYASVLVLCDFGNVFKHFHNELYKECRYLHTGYVYKLKLAIVIQNIFVRRTC